MSFKGSRENWLYAIISIFIILLIFIAVLFSSNDIKESIIPDNILGENWYEDYNERYTESRIFGLEKQISFTYKVDDKIFPSFLTVNTYKTIFMINEKDLFEKTVDTIFTAMNEKNITLEKNSKIEGQRVLKNGHKTRYILYNGTKILDNGEENIKIIGETWNCGESGTSVIVIGFSQTTNNSQNKSDDYLVHWAKMIRDQANTFDKYFKDDDYSFLGEDGLIFNIKCH